MPITDYRHGYFNQGRRKMRGKNKKNVRPNLTSLTLLFKASDLPKVARYTKVGLLLVHGNNCGRMPFLPPPMTHRVPVGVEPRLAGCKSATLTIEPRLLLMEIKMADEIVRPKKNDKTE